MNDCLPEAVVFFQAVDRMRMGITVIEAANFSGSIQWRRMVFSRFAHHSITKPHGRFEYAFSRAGQMPAQENALVYYARSSLMSFAAL